MNVVDSNRSRTDHNLISILVSLDPSKVTDTISHMLFVCYQLKLISSCISVIPKIKVSNQASIKSQMLLQLHLCYCKLLFYALYYYYCQMY
jgi:hypothetical protein